MVGIMRIAMLGAALAATPAWAQVYKWVDEQGRTHYGEKPPAKGAAQVKSQDAAGAPKPGGSGDLKQQEKDFQQRQAQRNYETERELRRKNAAQRRKPK